jgi:hypothetical protein
MLCPQKQLRSFDKIGKKDPSVGMEALLASKLRMQYGKGAIDQAIHRFSCGRR